jgi:hypothetical protein
MQFFRRPRVAQMAGDGFENLQLPQTVAHDSIIYTK